MSGPQYPGNGPEGQQPHYGQSPPQYGDPDLNKPQPGAYPPPPPAGQYPPPPAGHYPPSGQYPPPPPAGQSPYQQGIYSTTGQPAGLGVRFGARFIDGLIVGIPVAIVNVIVSIAAGWAISYVFGLVLSFVAIGYFTYLESTRGSTIGKQLLKLKTIGPDGGVPTQEVAFKRNIWLLLNSLSSLLSIIFFLPFLVALASLAVVIAIAVSINNDPNKQGVHDKFAGGTRVVRV